MNGENQVPPRKANLRVRELEIPGDLDPDPCLDLSYMSQPVNALFCLSWFNLDFCNIQSVFSLD